MQIRSEQIQAFEDAAGPGFETYMVSHLRDYTPLHYASLGPDGIRGLVRAGVERAAAHGFTTRGPVRLFVETTVLLGIGFDTDPQYPWARATLSDPETSDPQERAERLHGQLINFLDAAGGPDREYARRSLLKAREIPMEAASPASPGFDDLILAKLEEMYPEKLEYLGREAALGLVPRAIDSAKRYDVDTDEGVCLFLGLMYAVGHEVAVDPKYPWVMNTLTNPAITSRERRVERLYSKTMTYLDHVLRHLGLQ